MPSPDCQDVSGGPGTCPDGCLTELGAIALTCPGFDVVFKDTQGFAQTESVTWGGGRRSADGVTNVGLRRAATNNGAAVL